MKATLGHGLYSVVKLATHNTSLARCALKIYPLE